MPIAVNLNSGRPIEGDWAIYGIIDQLIWRVPDSKKPKGIGLFGRVVGAPTDQNLVDFYADGGITFSGMLPHRPDDALGIGLAYTAISSEAHGFDLYLGPAVAEVLAEVCYTVQSRQGRLDCAAGLPIHLAARWRRAGTVGKGDGRERGRVGSANDHRLLIAHHTCPVPLNGG